MTSQEIRTLTDQYMMHTYGRFPVAIDHGEGARLYDPEGPDHQDWFADCTPEWVEQFRPS